MSSHNKNLAAMRGLYAITPDDCLLPRLSALVAEALVGGVRIVQYRNKLAPPPLRRSQAAELIRICRAHDAALIINDDPALAAELGADGVHVGREDGGVARARAIVGPDAIVGASCYNDFQLAEAAVAAGADYVAFGAMFPSTVKPEAVTAPISLIAQARSQLNVPVCAIGGIRLENVGQLIDAGVNMASVITDLFDAPNLTERARAYQALFGASR